jgi:hypothetical protein
MWQAYMLLGTLETMLGNTLKAKRYLNFAEAIQAGIVRQQKEVLENARLGSSVGPETNDSCSPAVADYDVLNTVLRIFSPRTHDVHDTGTLYSMSSNERTHYNEPAVSQTAQNGSISRHISALKLAVGMKDITHKVARLLKCSNTHTFLPME